jgi:hypothetical protein
MVNIGSVGSCDGSVCRSPNGDCWVLLVGFDNRSLIMQHRSQIGSSVRWLVGWIRWLVDGSVHNTDDSDVASLARRKLCRLIDAPRCEPLPPDY